MYLFQEHSFIYYYSISYHIQNIQKMSTDDLAMANYLFHIKIADAFLIIIFFFGQEFKFY